MMEIKLEQSEEVPSTTRPSPEELCLKQHGCPNRWPETRLSHKTLCQLLARHPTDVNGATTQSPQSPTKADKFFLEENNNITYDVEGVSCPGDDTAEDKRMNANSHGHNRNSSRSTNGSVVTSGDSWTSDVSASPGQSGGPTRQPHQGMLSGRPSSQVQESSTHTSTMLASAGSPANLSGIFRTPATHVDSTQRHLSTGSQFSTLYSSTGGGGGGGGGSSPYSNLHGAHQAAVVAAQGSHMQAPYSAFYPQFPSHSGYTHRSMLAAHYPHIESYSAVLQSMGSQVQHASQTQLPRNSYLPGQIPQYSILGGNQRSLSVSTSPGPQVAPRHSPASGQHSGESAARDIKSPLKYERDMEGHSGGREYSPHYKEDRTHSLSSIELGSGGKSVSFKDLPPRHDSLCSKDQSDYKVPSGKEGSRKHRILTRPSDSVIESSSIDVQSGSYSSNRSSDQPSPKRSKTGYGASLPNPHGASVEQGVVEVGAGAPQSSNLHYPPHFMKGSIIQLANGELKRVEDLQTDDFGQSADISSDLKIDSSTVVRMEEKSDGSTVVLGFVVGEHRVQVTVEATVEHPFFVFGQGWSSCDPDKTLERYGLECHRLSVGDICISLTHKEVTARGAEISQQQLRHQEENKHLQQGRSPTLTFQTPRSINKCSQSQGEMYFNVSTADSVEKSPQNSPMDTDINQDQHLVDSRPPRKRHWSSSDHNNDSVHNDQKKQE
ncbi:ataxin-1-like [Pecten maximus]|uniref:ataxin-1-like n=1 Tax=Pecten maximus TaxID=6579 RepID=UPI0014588E2D|nr:ataxin-1-like [Pecten maximus]